ncbi:TonB-dependent receptor [Halioxenophilus aromaticivorans]
MPSAQAQQNSRSSAVLLEEVVVTARKRDENSQDVPLAISAYGEGQLDALKVRDLEDLSVGMPNVSLDDTGTARGYANFSIRGLGINSSIISIDPTVGMFVDGVYLGVSAGQVFDMFDLESIEVLRGPQGILFGRNVTGGAILVNTKKPGDEFEGSVRAAVDGGGDGGLNRYLMGSVSGPLSDTFAGKLSLYVNDDEGWFENQHTGDDFGEVREEMARAVGVWTPSSNTEFVFRLETGETESDGPPAQSHTNGSGVPGTFANFDRDSHDFAIDEEGFYNSESDAVTIEANIDVGFGDGTITNILGWRQLYTTSLGDIDSQPVWIFHSASWTDAEQISNELRYSGTFGENTTLTTGLYYFNNDVQYHERRELLGIATGGVAPAATFDGGGYYEVETIGVFAAVDYALTDMLTLTAGLRYTQEEKEARIASLSQNIASIGVPTCNLVAPAAGEAKCTTDFNDDDSWNSLSPKLGLTYLLSDDAQVYAHWTRGFRSGGYNLRNTSFNPADVPGPFDEETVDAFEVGYKSTYEKGRLNAAVFYNRVSDMQREVNYAGPIGVVQLVRNTADADVMGLELDATYSVSDSIILTAGLGYTNAEYTDMKADLNRDGVVDSSDEGLELPRAPELTYSLGINHDMDIGDWGYMSSRISYSYRDDQAYTDDNLGYILDQEILNAGIDLSSADGAWQFGIYGKNLLNDVKHGGDTQLPNEISGVPTGGTFSPLSKGRIIGVEATYNF